MAAVFSVSLNSIMKELSLEALYMPKNPDDIQISTINVNRLGLELTGFLDYFDNERILLFGNRENAYLQSFNDEERYTAIKNILILRPPVLIITRNLDALPEMLEIAELYGVPILRTAEATSTFIATLVAYMNIQLAPRVTRHGVLVEVYGEGMLIIGDSGVGKSENAIELINRGHRLIADDAVEVRRVSKNSLVGAAPSNIRHFIELRGIGIINARRIFGMGAVKLTSKVDMVVNLEQWDDTKVYDRMGIDSVYTEILGIKLPIITIPVKPGRNLSIIIEVAAMNNRLKKMGYNAAQDLLSGLGIDYPDNESAIKQKIDWEL